jgi:MFS family permease
VEYEINTEYESYFDNWYNQMDFMCESPQKYMAMGSVFCACAGISGLLLSPFVDRIGRRKTIMTF